VQTSSGGVEVDLEVKTGSSRTRLDLVRTIFGRGVHVLALAAARPLSQPNQSIGVTGNVRGNVTARPGGQPAGSAPLLIGHQDGVSQQTLGGGPDQPAQRLKLRGGRRCGGSHAPYRNARPALAGGLDDIPFQV